MNTEEKIEAAGKKKEEGNVLFKAGKYERASKRYEKVHPIPHFFSFSFIAWLFIKVTTNYFLFLYVLSGCQIC